MARPSEKPDPRILRTKQALRKALLELIQEDGYQNITVKRIAERAGLNRTTFYLHYRNKEDLLTREYSRLRDRLADAFPLPVDHSTGNYLILDRSCVQENFQFLEECAPLYQALLGKNGPPFFTQRLIEDLVESSEESHSEQEVLEDAKIQKLTLVYQVTGYLGLLEWWLEKGCPVPPERMADLVMALIKNRPGNAMGQISATGRKQLF